MIDYLVIGLGLGFAAAVQPGPFMTYLIAQALADGFRRTWVAALAPLISDGPIIAVTLLVLSQLPGWLQRGMHVASGVFILYLAADAARKWWNFAVGRRDPRSAPTGLRRLLHAAAMNGISPLPYLYWGLVTGPILLAGWRQSPWDGMAFLTGFYVVLVGGLVALMALFSAAQLLGERISRALLGVSALGMAVFGALQLWRGIAG